MHWKDEYLKIKTDPNLSIEEIDRARILKNSNIPKALFKLFPPTENSFSNLEKSQVWLVTPDKFNDPYDSALFYNPEKFWAQTFNKPGKAKEMLSGILNEEQIQNFPKVHKVQDTIEYTMEALVKSGKFKDKPLKIEAEVAIKVTKNILREMGAQFGQVIRTGYKVACFTERVDSVVMWSHYAKAHTGFAIEYDFASLPDHEIRKNMLFPVYYVDDLFCADKYMETSGGKSAFVGVLACIQKSKDWSYEQEWRLIDNFDRNKPAGRIEMHPPANVYLGSLMAEGHRERILNFCTKKRINCFQMELISNSFRMSWTEPT